MKYRFALLIALTSSGLGLMYRVHRDFRLISTEIRTPAVPTFHVFPRLSGYDYSGNSVALPPVVGSVAVVPLHQFDDALQTRIWRQALASLQGSKGIVVIGVLADGESRRGSGLEGAPWFRSVVYANYMSLAFVADLDRRNEIAILDGRGIVQRRLPRPTDAGQLKAAFP